MWAALYMPGLPILVPSFYFLLLGIPFVYLDKYNVLTATVAERSTPESWSRPLRLFPYAIGSSSLRPSQRKLT